MENKIYLKTERIFNLIEELLTFGFSQYLSVDILDDDHGKFVPTYLDIECSIRQCHPARRSFGDLLIICQTYFPNTTKVDLMKILLKLNKTINLGMIYCGDIRKVVFRVYNNSHIQELSIGNFHRNDKENLKEIYNEVQNLENVAKANN